MESRGNPSSYEQLYLIERQRSRAIDGRAPDIGRCVINDVTRCLRRQPASRGVSSRGPRPWRNGAAPPPYGPASPIPRWRKAPPPRTVMKYPISLTGISSRRRFYVIITHRTPDALVKSRFKIRYNSVYVQHCSTAIFRCISYDL